METQNEDNIDNADMRGSLHITFRPKEDFTLCEKSKKDMDNAQKAEDEHKNLITDSNILTALRGAFSAYGKMDQKQFRHIVGAFNSSVYNE